jgi:hypothetical protein
MAKTIGQLNPATTIANGDLFVIEQSSQTFKIAASVVRGGLVDADVDAAAAIAFSKLAALDDANILVGNGSNVATKVAVTGDVTISNAGVTAIGNDKVVTAMILDANVTPAKLSQPYTLATAQASTSGTSIDFTGIPSWAKRITVMFDGVSVSGSSAFLLQAGTSGGIVATGYSGGGVRYGATNIAAASFTAGVSPNNSTAGAAYSGHAIWTLVSGNIWTCSLNFGASGGVESGCMAGGSVTLSSALTQLRITTVNGTDTFDAGSINISYEG